MSRPPAAALVIDEGQRVALVGLAASQAAPHRQVQRAKALLLAADGVANSHIAQRIGGSVGTVRAWRDRFAEDGLTILASSETTDARCPVCGGRADRVHSRYARTLADLPWATLPVRLRVSVRKFFCDNDACPRHIFAERLAGVALVSARRTDRQRAALTAIAFASGGEAGARLAASLGDPVSPDTLLRLIRDDPRRSRTAPAGPPPARSVEREPRHVASDPSRG